MVTYGAGLVQGLLVGLLLAAFFYRLHLRTRRRSSEVLREAAERRERFLSSINHEVRTPLNGILGSTALLSSGKLNDEQHESVHVIKTAAESILTVLEATTDHLALADGRIQFTEEPLDLLNILEDAADEHSCRHFGEGLPITILFDMDLPYVLADPKRVRQMFDYVVGAAACSGAHEVRLHLKRIDTHGPHSVVQLEVACIGESHLNDSFLTLDLSQKWAEAMGGYLAVSSGPDEPTTIWLVLNLKDAPEARSMEKMTGNVLICSRDAILGESVHLGSKALGFEATVCLTARAMLTMLQQQCFTHLIIDDADPSLLEIARRIAPGPLKIIGLGISGPDFDATLLRPCRRSRLRAALSAHTNALTAPSNRFTDSTIGRSPSSTKSANSFEGLT